MFPSVFCGLACVLQVCLELEIQVPDPQTKGFQTLDVELGSVKPPLLNKLSSYFVLVTKNIAH